MPETKPNHLQKKIVISAALLCLLAIIFPPVDIEHKIPGLSDGQGTFTLETRKFAGWTFIGNEDLVLLEETPIRPRDPKKPTLLDRLEALEANDPKNFGVGKLKLSKSVLAMELAGLFMLLGTAYFFARKSQTITANEE